MHFILSFLAGIIFYHSFQYFPYITVAFGVLISALFFIYRKPLPVLALILALAYAFLRCQPVPDIPFISQTTVIRCAFETPPVTTESGFIRQNALIESARIETTGDDIPELIGCEVGILSDRTFEPGKNYELSVKFLKTKKRFNPGFPAAQTLYAHLSEVHNEFAGTPPLKAKLTEWRFRIHEFIMEEFQKDSGALIASITIGERSALSERMRNAFNTAGLAHILSISGTHFGLFSLFLFGIFRLFMKVLPYALLQRLTLYLTPAQAAAILSFPFMVAYLGLSGASIPAVRSFIMITLFLFALIIGRKGFWLNSLVFAAFIIVLLDPESILSLSFQLSFLAVLFIGFIIGNADKRQEKGLVVAGYFKNLTLLTLAASVGTAPLVAYYFHYFSVVSPVSNILITPIIGFILIPLSVIPAFVFLITGHYPFLPLVSAVAETGVAAVQKLSEVPYADIKIQAFPPVIILLFYAGFAVYFSMRHKKRLLLLPIIPVVFFSFFSMGDGERMTVTFLDVGQGDAAVVELPDGKTLVVDTGRTGREVASFLRYRGKRHIDALALSHVHPDHTGGMNYLRERFFIGGVWHGGNIILPDALQFPERRVLGRGDMIEGEGYEISVLHPYPEFYTARGNVHVGENNDSLVLRIADRHGAVLFTGDIEEEAAEDLVHVGKWLASDVIKVPHHGGRSSAHRPFLDAVNPEIAVISAERDNRFGHPHEEMLEALSGRKVMRTDIDGAIRIKSTARGFDIVTCGDFQLEKARGIDGEARNVKRLFQRW